MKKQARNAERGVALFFSIFALLLLTGIAASLILMATTETSVNTNYRQEQVAYFAAKAGIEEARARMMFSDPNSIAAALPTAAPTTANQAVIYITNPGFTSGSVKPWDTTSGSTAYADDELCHDGYGASFGTAVAPDVRCNNTQLPSGSSWYASYTSQLPFYNSTNSSAVMPYAWVRIAPKLNNSISHLTGTGSTATTVTYSVNSGLGASTIICWDGTEEVVLTAANCSAMLNAAGAPMNNAYLITALGVSSSASNAARKMVQAEVALSPTPPFPYGMFATSTACPALTFSGNNASTDSYTTAAGGTYATTKSSSGGDIGSNGGISIGNGNVGGLAGVLPVGTGPCAIPFTIGPNGADIGPNCPGPSCVPNSPTYLSSPYHFSTPPAPNPPTPNTTYSGSMNVVPGTYGNISITGNSTLTLAPGTYNINSISMAGKGQITVSPAGAVVLNIGGCGDATCSAANALANPLAIAGNGITDDSIPNDFLIDYAGAGTVSIAGNGDVTAILNAPNAAVTQVGNGNWYGSMLGSTFSLTGNAFFHYDRNAGLSPSSNGYFTMISYREVPY